MSSLSRSVLLPLLLATGGSAAAQNAETSACNWFQTEHQRLTADASSRLERLADWCHERQLYRQRDAAFRSILKFDPDHAEARKFLKFRRTKDGQWIYTGGYREPRERESTDLPAYNEMRTGLIADLSQQVFQILERQGGSVSSTERRSLLETLLELDPDHASARAELGEVLDPSGSAWILVESASTLKRRAELSALAERLVKAGPKVTAAEPELAEQELGLEWCSVLRTERVKLLSTSSGSAPAECVELAEAIAVLFDAALRPDARKSSGFTIYLLASASEKERLLAQHPTVGPARAAEFRPFDSFWIGRFDRGEVVLRPGKRELVVAAEALKDQLEHIVLQMTARKLCDQFGVSTREGIVHAGVTSYLSGLIDAARSAGSVSTAHCAGRAALDRPDLELMLRKPYRELSQEEKVAGGVLFGYLIESWPDCVPFVLGRVGSGTPLDRVLQDLLGFDQATLLARLERRDRETQSAQ